MNTTYRHARCIKTRIAGTLAAGFVTFALLQSVTSLFHSAEVTQVARATSANAVVASAR
jgi:hypothetical protein